MRGSARALGLSRRGEGTLTSYIVERHERERANEGFLLHEFMVAAAVASFDAGAFLPTTWPAGWLRKEDGMLNQLMAFLFLV